MRAEWKRVMVFVLVGAMTLAVAACSDSDGGDDDDGDSKAGKKVACLVDDVERLHCLRTELDARGLHDLSSLPDHELIDLSPAPNSPAREAVDACPRCD